MKLKDSRVRLSVVAVTCLASVGAARLVAGDTRHLPTFVTVGDAGNRGELSGHGAGGSGPDRVCGAVGYVYQMQRCEVTAAQYVEFLNAVAADDPYQLYDTQMATHSFGCRIERAGTPGSYGYSVAPDWANRPVNFVNWGDAARYANWLTNGQPTGPAGPTTTEAGSYALDGALSDAELLGITRQPDAEYVIPSEDEWYKSAYYRGAPTRSSYWNYPTQSDSTPSNDLLIPDPGNNANFYQYGYTLGPPYYRTEVGAFTNSASSYGTYDQGGNVKEWTEQTIGNTTRSVRGGSCFYSDADLHANKRVGIPPTTANNDLGFRVALVPEPAASIVLVVAALAVTRRRRRCRTLGK